MPLPRSNLRGATKNLPDAHLTSSGRAPVLPDISKRSDHCAVVLRPSSGSDEASVLRTFDARGTLAMDTSLRST